MPMIISAFSHSPLEGDKRQATLMQHQAVREGGGGVGGAGEGAECNNI